MVGHGGSRLKDAALRVVDRYYGREVASGTADFLEHHSTDWIDGVATGPG
ncbi:MAG: hypothetical protein ACXWOT_11410 [Candidatus Limnocylindrales bacterium]